MPNARVKQFGRILAKNKGTLSRRGFIRARQKSRLDLMQRSPQGNRVTQIAFRRNAILRVAREASKKTRHQRENLFRRISQIDPFVAMNARNLLNRSTKNTPLPKSAQLKQKQTRTPIDRVRR
ncbi:MAG: hypothetical protein WC652_01540 [archaeon]|jgi:hypothetical protein